MLDRRREERRSINSGQDTDEDPLENERKAGMDGYSGQDLSILRDFQHKIVSEGQQGREAYLPIQRLSFGYSLENLFSSRADWGNIKD